MQWQGCWESETSSEWENSITSRVEWKSSQIQSIWEMRALWFSSTQMTSRMLAAFAVTPSWLPDERQILHVAQIPWGHQAAVSHWAGQTSPPALFPEWRTSPVQPTWRPDLPGRLSPAKTWSYLEISSVVPWLGVCLPVMVTWVWSPVGDGTKIPHALSNWAQATQSPCVTTKTQPNKQINAKRENLSALCLLVTCRLTLCNPMDSARQGFFLNTEFSRNTAVAALSALTGSKAVFFNWRSWPISAYKVNFFSHDF